MPAPHGGRLVQSLVTAKEKERIIEEWAEMPRLIVSEETARDVENIAFGAFSPLEGFLCGKDYACVLERMRLSNDLPWTIPIVLDASRRDVAGLKQGDEVALLAGGDIHSLLKVEEIYSYSKRRHARLVYGTGDPRHPGVGKTLGMREMLVGGRVRLVEELENPYGKYLLRPVETRILFGEKGWKTVAGFQTRNVPHLGHEYVQKTALAFVDGVFINPVAGRKKQGDFRDEVILSAYDALLRNYYLRERVVLSVLQTEMRYAGPREALFHAIVRKNFGCTHFIVGRDHAGVGDYYPPYAAQEIFQDFPDLGITPLFFSSSFYCPMCKSVTSDRICPHSAAQRVEFSGTQLRWVLRRKGSSAAPFLRPEVLEAVRRFENPFVEDGP